MTRRIASVGRACVRAQCDTSQRAEGQPDGCQPVVIATIENFAEMGTMLANGVAGDEHGHGLLTDTARTAIRDALRKLEPSKERS